MVNTIPTGKAQKHSKAIKDAAQIIILARRDDGDEYITREYLKGILGAKDKASMNSIGWALEIMKEAGIIIKIQGQRGLYKFA